MSDGASSIDSTPETKTDASASRPLLFSRFRVVSLLTLLSRVLGLIRDIGMAMLFGLGPVMDAFSVAFRIPNLARRLFGEGALTAAFLPAFVRELEGSKSSAAWQLATAVFVSLTLVLGGVVVLGELILGSIPLLWETGREADLLIGLTAVMLPYLILICLVAQAGAVLNALGHFTWPALAPVILNIVWIGGIWWLAPLLSDQADQIYIIAVCITLAGILQLAAQLVMVKRLGFRFDRTWRDARSKVTDIGRAMVPIVVGLSVTQLNTLADSLIAWGFSQPETGTAIMSLPGNLEYPLQTGTASALYYGQRMYQLPLGLFGVALGTVLFPILARHAERGRLDRLKDDLSLGLRLVIGIGLPASIGLVLLAAPLTALLFQHGRFDLNDARQTSGMIAAYGIAVWAYSALLIVHRGYYAIGDRQTPMRIGLAAVGLNLTLNFTLIWFLGGWGLALSTALTAMVQVALVIWFIQHRIGKFDWNGLLKMTLRTAAATTVMAAVCMTAMYFFPTGETLLQRFFAVFFPVAASVAVYFVSAKFLNLNELWLLFKRDSSGLEPDEKR